jgi:hypothetical protein
MCRDAARCVSACGPCRLLMAYEIWRGVVKASGITTEAHPIFNAVIGNDKAALPKKNIASR